MRKAFLVFALLGLVTSAAAAQDGGSRRSGFWLNVGLGWGSADWGCDNCISLDRESGLSGQLALGGTVSDHLLLGVESNGWAGSDVFGGVDDFLIGTFNAVAYFYPSASGNLFFKGGVGIASWRIRDRLGDEDDIGLGLLAGVGYDIPVGRSFSISPVATFQYGTMGDKSGLKGVTQNVVSVGATFTLH